MGIFLNGGLRPLRGLGGDRDSKPKSLPPKAGCSSSTHGGPALRSSPGRGACPTQMMELSKPAIPPGPVVTPVSSPHAAPNPAEAGCRTAARRAQTMELSKPASSPRAAALQPAGASEPPARRRPTPGRGRMPDGGPQSADEAGERPAAAPHPAGLGAGCRTAARRVQMMELSKPAIQPFRRPGNSRVSPSPPVCRPDTRAARVRPRQCPPVRWPGTARVRPSTSPRHSARQSAGPARLASGRAC